MQAPAATGRDDIEEERPLGRPHEDTKTDPPDPPLAANSGRSRHCLQARACGRPMNPSSSLVPPGCRQRLLLPGRNFLLDVRIQKGGVINFNRPARSPTCRRGVATALRSRPPRPPTPRHPSVSGVRKRQPSVGGRPFRIARGAIRRCDARWVRGARVCPVPAAQSGPAPTSRRPSTRARPRSR